MSTFLKKYGIFISLAILIGIISMPTPEGLSISGHRMLALLVFSVILWMTECISYPASAAVILSLMVLLLGFASATALAAAMIPIIIAVLQEIKTPGINIIGMTMILQYVVSFGFILPVNAPQNMIAYGTDTFSVKDFTHRYSADIHCLRTHLAPSSYLLEMAWTGRLIP